MFLFSCRSSGSRRAGFQMEDQQANSWPMSKLTTPWTPSLLRYKLLFPSCPLKIPVAKTQFKHWRASWVCRPKRLHRELWRIPGGFSRGRARRCARRHCEKNGRQTCVFTWAILLACMTMFTCLFNRNEASFSFCQLCNSSHLSSSPPQCLLTTEIRNKA